MKTVEIKFPDFPTKLSDESKVWVYQAERNLTEEEVSSIRRACEKFIPSWQAHGKNLLADYGVYFNRFLCLFVDETQAGATGCSIDRSVHFIQELERALGIGLMQRTRVIYLNEDGEIAEIEMTEMSDKISGSTTVFNNLLSTLGEMKDGWIGPASESWHAKMI